MNPLYIIIPIAFGVAFGPMFYLAYDLIREKFSKTKSQDGPQTPGEER